MTAKVPSPAEKRRYFPMQSKPPPRPARRVSPAEWAWLDRINRQLAYDEYMQAKREFWLWERPPKNETG